MILPNLVAIGTVILKIQDYMIIWSRDFVGRSHSRNIIILPCFVALRIVLVEMF